MSDHSCKQFLCFFCGGKVIDSAVRSEGPIKVFTEAYIDAGDYDSVVFAHPECFKFAQKLYLDYQDGLGGRPPVGPYVTNENAQPSGMAGVQSEDTK